MSPPIKMRRLRPRKQNWKQNDTSTSSSRIQNQRSSIHIPRGELFNLVCNYEGYTNSVAPDVTVREGLYNLEDVTAYGVSEAAQKELWDKEVERLSSALEEPEKSIQFVGTEELSHDTKDAYDILAHLADQMWIALNIVILDCQATLSRHFPLLTEDDQLRSSRDILEKFTAEDENEEDDATRQAETANSGSKGTREDYFQLVDYLTATLARTLCKAASGDTWHYNILANLVKLSTKLKVVSFRLEEFASDSLESAPAKRSPRLPSAPASRDNAPLNTGMGRDGGGSLDFLGEMLSTLHREDGNTERAYSGPNTRKNAVKQLYWLETVKFKRPIHKIFQYILVSLRGQKKLTTTSTTSYEICAMVFDTNFQEFSTFVYQDIDGEYLGASKPENISVANAVFEVLTATMKTLDERQPETDPRNVTNVSGGTNASANRTSSGTPNEETAESNASDTAVAESSSSRTTPQSNTVGTTISWSYTATDPDSQIHSNGSRTSSNLSTDEQSRMKDKKLKSMSEVIMVMVPLLLASPRVIDMMTDFIGLCVHTARPEKICLNSATKKYKAIFFLNTAEYRELWTERPSVSQLSRSPMAGVAIPSCTDGRRLQMNMTLSEQSQKYQNDLQAVTNAMKEWIFEENGVRVRSEWYVWTVLTIALTLVLGGIASGILINDRLTGVDPFNITTFCWVLAAFIVLLAKSVRVSNWPWRDFLRRTVLCRSVSELHSMTGIDEQLILGKLLQVESDSRLQTRGPYNCVFTQKTSSADGFSIDHPMSIQTMLLSGLVMIQVEAIFQGEFLVCLDLRKGTSYHVVQQSKDPTDDREYIVSDRLATDGVQDTSRQRIPLQKRGDARWNRVVGVYSEQDCLFT